MCLTALDTVPMHKSGFRTLIYIHFLYQAKKTSFRLIFCWGKWFPESLLAQEMYYRTEAYLLSLDNLSSLSGLYNFLFSHLLMCFLLSHPLLVLLDASADRGPSVGHCPVSCPRSPHILGNTWKVSRQKTTGHDVFVLLNQKLRSGWNWFLSLASVVTQIAQFNYFCLWCVGCLWEFCCLPLLQISRFQ